MASEVPAGSKLVVRFENPLCGHPLAGKLWQRNLTVLPTALGDSFSFFSATLFSALRIKVLLLNVYVDDLTWTL